MELHEDKKVLRALERFREALGDWNTLRKNDLNTSGPHGPTGGPATGHDFEWENSTARNAALELIATIRNYMQHSGPGGRGDDLDERVLATFAGVIAQLAAAGLPTHPFTSGSPTVGFRKSKLPIGMIAKDEDHREAILSVLGLEHTLRKASRGGRNVALQLDDSGVHLSEAPNQPNVLPSAAEVRKRRAVYEAAWNEFETPPTPLRKAADEESGDEWLNKSYYSGSNAKGRPVRSRREAQELLDKARRGEWD